MERSAVQPAVDHRIFGGLYLNSKAVLAKSAGSYQEGGNAREERLHNSTSYCENVRPANFCVHTTSPTSEATTTTKPFNRTVISEASRTRASRMEMG